MKAPRRRRRFMMRRKRTLDPSIAIDYKKPDVLKRFITERGKIIPRRISGATAKQQRQICEAVKRARFLSLIPYSISHRTDKGFSGDMAASAMSMGTRDFGGRGRYDGPREGGGGFRGDRDGPREGGGGYESRDGGRESGGGRDEEE